MHLEMKVIEIIKLQDLAKAFLNKELAKARRLVLGS